MQTKIKTITTIEEDNFDQLVNSFTKDKKVVATQTHVNFFEDNDGTRIHMFTAVIYYQE